MTSTTKPAPIIATPLWRVRLRLFFKSAGDNWKLFAENKVGVVGLVIIAAFGFLAAIHPVLIATQIWPSGVYDPLKGYDPSIEAHPSPPSTSHLLGTDPQGRDVLSQLMYSTRWEFLLGVTSAVVTVVIATTIGAFAAYYGGILDIVLMRLADLVIMVPLLPILIVLSGLTSVGILELAIVIGILSGFGGTTIVIKSQALTVKVKPFIEAARVAGGSDFHIIFKHMLPNLLPISLLYMMFVVTGAIFTEAVLSFFGLTTIQMSWGIMINLAQAFGYLLNFNTWYLLFPASMAITLLCAAFYLVGRAMDEVVNPRLRKR